MSDFQQSVFRRLEEYSKSDYYPFHMPGHKRQPFLSGMSRSDASALHSGDCPSASVCPERIDITEISGFDDLHHPDGILKEAQERMADVFGAKKSFFLVNGSTAGILAAICACTKKGDRILMARNCHKAVYHAAFLQELSIDYIEPSVTDWGIAASISPDAVQQALSVQSSSLPHCPQKKCTGKRLPGRYPDDRYAAVILTSPTYDGIVSDIRSIAAIVHAYGIPLIVDAAHGAHFGFSDGFPESALQCGADIAIESLHKTLPAYTQSAALHLSGSPYADEAKIRRYLSIFQTSSPSYILMAGLDRCVQLLQTDGSRLFSAFQKKLAAFYAKAAGLKHISVFSEEDNPAIYRKDPSRILISADMAGLDGAALFTRLRDLYHLEPEMASLHYVIALTSVMDTKEGFDRLICALQETDQSYAASGAGASASPHPDTFADNVFLPVLPADATAPMPIHEAYALPAETQLLAACPGRVCADFIIPYPPGIPLLVPGESITAAHIRKIRRYLSQGIPVYGAEPGCRL